LPILFVLGIFGLWFLNREVARKTERLTAQIRISETTKIDLMESESHLRTLIDTLPDLIWLKDPKGAYISCNSRFEDFFGAREKDIVGKTDYDFVDKELADFFRKNDREAISKGQPGINEEKIVFANDGHHEILETIKTPIYANSGQLIGVLGIGRDITLRKQAEEVIRHERDQFDLIMETSPAGIVRVDKQGKIVYANNRAEKILGIRLSEGGPRTYDDPVWKITDFYGNPVPAENLPFNRVRKTGRPIFDDQHAIEWPDGSQVFLSINAMPLRGDSGEFDGMVASIDDITEKYRAEQNYKMLFTEMLDGFALHEIVCDDSGNPVDYRFLEVNPAFERLTGLNKESLIGRTVLDALPRIEPLWVKKYGQVALTGVPDSFESYSKDLDRHFRVTAFRYARNQFACIFVDVTVQKALERRINQAQKMESIGNLAGGIAHDFNNLLFPIMGMSELLMEDFGPDSIEYANAQEIYTAGKRGSQLVQQILAFSRQTENTMVPVRIQQILKEVLKLTRSSIPADIVIEADIRQDCGLVMADPTQIHQIAMNLITNAYHAVEEGGGRIGVQLRELDSPDGEFSGNLLKKGGYVRLTVSDTGCGIDPQVINKIFEPYFTTKVQGKGTGLGLSVVYGIVKENKGEIKVRSEVGEGTVFDVILPLMDPSTVSISGSTPEIFKTGTERILLVDDEAPILKLEKQMLEKLGYTVTIQTGSVEALDLLSINPHAFDLVITDMSMPVMTGMDMASQIIKLRPDIPIILCTGFSERISEQSMEESGIRRLLMKPVVKYEMAKAIREVLDK
jgi:PAS domain S-box-containing protein